MVGMAPPLIWKVKLKLPAPIYEAEGELTFCAAVALLKMVSGP